jgi:hypothetical protein
MDTYNASLDLDYLEARSELEDHNIRDAIDMYLLRVEFLATFGKMKREHAVKLQKYVRDKLLRPFGLLETGHGDGSVEEANEDGSVEEINHDVAQNVAPTHTNEEEPLTSTRWHKKQQEDIFDWLEGVTKVESEVEEMESEVEEAESDIEEVDELVSDADDVESEGDAVSEEV